MAINGSQSWLQPQEQTHLIDDSHTIMLSRKGVQAVIIRVAAKDAARSATYQFSLSPVHTRPKPLFDTPIRIEVI